MNPVNFFLRHPLCVGGNRNPLTRFLSMVWNISWKISSSFFKSPFCAFDRGEIGYFNHNIFFCILFSLELALLSVYFRSDYKD